MKTTISVTVDADALANAKKKVNNMSGYVNECINILANTPQEHLQNTDDELRQQLTEVTAQLSQLKNAKKKKENHTHTPPQKMTNTSPHGKKGGEKKSGVHTTLVHNAKKSENGPPTTPHPKHTN